MKKTLITLFVALVSFTTALADNDRAIQFNQLPQAAQTFLNSHFKNAKIAMVTTERDWLSQEYNVVFVNGDKIEFDSKGNWENIECKRTFIPQGAKSFPLDENGNPIKGIPRHPILEDNVIVYSNATVLGRITLAEGTVIGGNLWVTESTKPGEHLVQARKRISE